MTLNHKVSVSHETSSSESGNGGEAVEATLKVLAALKTVQDQMAQSPYSQQSQASTGKYSKSPMSKKSGHTYAEKSNTSKKSRKTSASNTSKSTTSASSMSEDGSLARSLPNQTSYPKGVAPLEPSKRNDPLVVEQVPRKKAGGLFSCCFNADEQIIITNQSRASSKQNPVQVVESNHNDAEVGDATKQPLDGLNDFERAMIERLRELLSLDTSIPTLPTQVVLANHTSPVSLDITDSMIANTFSIDTKELQSVLQADQYNALGEVASHAGSAPSKQSCSKKSDESKKSFSSVKSQSSKHADKDTPKNSDSSSEHNSIRRTESSHSRKLSVPTNASQQDKKTTVSGNQSIRSRKSSQSLRKAASKEIFKSKTSKQMTEDAPPATTVERNNSYADASKTSSRKLKLRNMLPPRPEHRSAEEKQKQLKKSSSHADSTSKMSNSMLPPQMCRSASKSSSRSKSTHGSSRSQQLETNSLRLEEDQPETVSLKRSKSSKSTSMASVGQQSQRSDTAHPAHNLTQVRSETSRTRVDSGNEDFVEEEPEIIEKRCFPPKPDNTPQKRDIYETIITSRGTRTEDPDDQGGFECIYQLDSENFEHPAIETIHSEEVVPRNLQLKQDANLRRAASAAIRYGPRQTLTRNEAVEYSRVLGESIQNVPGYSTATDNSAKAQKDVRDDISDISMVSPKNINPEEKENTETEAALVEPAKVGVLDMFTGGLFCCRADTSNAVL